MIIKSVTKEEKLMLENKFGRVDLEEDDNPHLRFQVGVLDRFDHCLSESEAEQLLTPQLNLKYEPYFLKVFREMYLLNKAEVYVFSKDLLDPENFNFKLLRKHLNEKDYKLLRNLVKNKESLFKIKDYDMLSFFVRFSINTICFSNFFFTHIGTAIIGNYDMSFPIYCLQEENFNESLRIAGEHNLYIRR